MHAQARYTIVYNYVYVWSVCVDCYSCSRINELQEFLCIIGFYVMDLQNNASVMPIV